MNEPTRRAWSRPELIVLVRSTPEETALSGCKTAAQSGDSVITNTTCTQLVSLSCADCSAPVSS
jgi:hypothetical protein